MIVLDTHAWLWWVSDPAKLGRSAKREIEKTSRIGVPAICALEVAVSVSRGRLSLDRATLSGQAHVVIIHGHGTGALRRRVRAYLDDSRYVARWAPGSPRQGGDGVSVVELR